MSDAPQYDICMLVENDVTSDSRVLKEASSLAKAGWNVLAVGVCRNSDVPDEEIVFGFTVKRYKIPQTTLSKAYSFILSIMRRAAVHAYSWFPPSLKWASPFRRLFLDIFFYISRTGNLHYITLRRAIKDMHGHIYHAHDYPTLWMLHKMNKRPLIYDSHELYFDRDYGGQHPRMQAMLEALKERERQIEREIIPDTEYVITVGDKIADHMADTWQSERPVVLRNAVDLRRNEASDLVYPTDGHPTIVHPGGLVYGRHLLEIAQSLQHLPENIRVVLMGDGILKSEIIKIAQKSQSMDKLVMVPRVRNFQVSTTMSQADAALVLTSRFSGLNGEFAMPNKLFEGIAAGLPLVAGPNKEISSIIRQYDIGVICEPEKPQSIAEAIVEVLDPERNQYFRKNVIKAREELNWEKEEQKLFDIYHKLNGKGNQAG